MKKFTQILLALGLMFNISVLAQVVPNAGFENWETNNAGGQQPVGWMAAMNTSMFSNVTEVEGHNGGSAAQLIAVNIPGAGVISPMLASDFFNVDQKYSRLSGYLKAAPLGGDTLFIVVGMYKGEEDLVGIGVGFVKQDFADFNEFSVSIFYTGDDMPDQCIITFIAGTSDASATEGSTFTIDDLSLSDIAAIDDLSPVFAGVGEAYPSPANTYVHLPFELREPDEIEIAVFDISGRRVFQKPAQYFASGAHEVSLETSTFQSGTYIYSIIPSDGKIVSRKFMVK